MKPRLKRTLKRKPTFHDLDVDDIKYIWAAYKKGAFNIQPDLSPKDFEDRFVDHVTRVYSHSWIMSMDKPVGIVFGVSVLDAIFIRDMTWFPWATDRNRIEGIVNFINELRKQYKLIFTCTREDNEFYLYVAKHGILRRVGHLHDIEKEPVILWESKGVE